MDVDIYLDESGTHERVYCVCAGLLAETEAIRVFESEWQKVLNEYKVTEPFHAKEFFHRDSDPTSPYRGWSDAKALSYISALATLLSRGGGIRPYATIVDVVQFDRRTEDERKFLTGAHWVLDRWRWTGAPQEPYHAAFIDVVNQCLRTNAATINFFHDEQRTFAPYALRLLVRARNRLQPESDRTRLGPLVYGTRSVLVPLQGADLVAHAIYRRIRYGIQDRLPPARKPEVRAVLDALNTHDPFARLFDGNTIANHLRRLPMVIRAGIAPRQRLERGRRVTGRAEQKRRQEMTRRTPPK